MSTGAVEKGCSPWSSPSSALFRVSTPLVKSPQSWIKKGGGQNKICIHICSHGNHSACHSLVKPHQGRWGALSGSWWALPGTDLHPHPAPLPPSDQHPGHLPHCYFALTPIQLILYFTNHMTDDHRGLKRRNGDNAMQYCGIAFMILVNRWWQGWIKGKFWGPPLSYKHLKDFSALVYRSGGVGRQCGVLSSMTGCQDQFYSHNGRKGHLTSVIFSNRLC